MQPRKIKNRKRIAKIVLIAFIATNSIAVTQAQANDVNEAAAIVLSEQNDSNQRTESENQKETNKENTSTTPEETTNKEKQDEPVDLTPLQINIDTDGDGIADINIDTDGDGIADLNIDINGDEIADLNIDTNGDGIADSNIDNNGDGIADFNLDTDDDGELDINIDNDNDDMPDINIDINGDGVADLNIDLDGDGIPTLNLDMDNDNKADLNIDTDGDGIADTNIDLDGNTHVDINIDTDGDDIADLNIDTDGDGIANINLDIDGDGKADLNIDTDGDGVADLNVDGDGDQQPDSNVDNDHDGVIDPQPEQPQQSTHSQQPTTPEEYYPPTHPSQPDSSVADRYEGPVKQWPGIPRNSKRYQLKRAAESMLGWNYSQPLRMTDGYRDCSSFVYTAIADAGLAPKVSWAWTTYTMPSYTNLVEQIPMSALRPGDIVLGDGHVAFYWGTDPIGWRTTLECCGGYGVTYGYMMCCGWNFPYTSAWRIKGIDDGTANCALLTDEQKANLPNGIVSNANNTLSTSNNSPIIPSTGSDPNAIDITKEKLDGKVIDLLDLDKNAEYALEIYLNKNLTETDYNVLEKLEGRKKLQYLLQQVAIYKNADTATVISKYIDVPFEMPMNAKNNKHLMINSLIIEQ